jgi:hypothetical protein
MKLLVQALSKDDRLAGIALQDEHVDFLRDLAMGRQHKTPETAEHAKELVALAYGIKI